MSRRGKEWAERQARRLFSLDGVELAAPIDVLGIAKHLGAVVQMSTFPKKDEVSGFFLRAPEGPVIAVNKDHPLVRRRFTIAHEIGHMQLHTFEGLHLDSARMNRDRRSSTGTDLVEVEANAFAAELLMPADLIREHCDGCQLSFVDEEAAMREIKRLAKTFKVSPQAMQWRLTNLELLV